jgi:alpha-L-arabinofuranosidase
VDGHYYNNPDWFIWNANKYDTYDRKGPKIFIGEYAVTENTGKENLRGGIGEAAWMTGMEHNSDVVVMGSYAPLFCNANHKAWPVNLTILIVTISMDFQVITFSRCSLKTKARYRYL